MNTPRVYAACLSSYNNGVLHGRWIDADQGAEGIMDDIRAMLKASPYPNIVKQTFECEECGEEWESQVGHCFTDSKAALHMTFDMRASSHCGKEAKPVGEPYPTAEEWAFHDYEGFGSYRLSEYESVAEIARMAEGLEEAERTTGDPEVYSELRANGYDHDETMEKLEDCYQGCYKSLGDWAHDLAEDCGDMDAIPDHLVNYINWDAAGRDADLNGDILTVETGFEEIHIFWAR